MEFDYSKILGKIKEIFGTQEAFSKELGISSTSLIAKLSNKVKFKQEEIYRAMILLNLDFLLLREYFFTLKVEKNQQK